MKGITALFLVAIMFLAACTMEKPASTPTLIPPTIIPSSPVPRFTMLPTWTPAKTSTPKATRTPRNTSTPLVTTSGYPIIAGGYAPELLVDRPTYAQLAKPANLVTMEYDPAVWSVSTAYPTDFMGYALTHNTIFGCKLEPSVGKGAEGYQVEHFSRKFGVTSFEIARVGQAGVLVFANYCSGEGEDYTCYQVTPGDNHEGCTQAAEEVLSTFNLIPNPFFGNATETPNRWICEAAAGTPGLCQISYSVPLNALAFTPDGQSWAAGDDGILLHREGQVWNEASSPTIHRLFDLSFASATNGWAVGDGAQVVRWNGSRWNEVLPYHGPGEGPGGSSQVLYAVDAFSVNEVWMVGAMKGIDLKNRPYALHWNGKDLLEENTFPECNCGLNAVLVIGVNDIYAAGGSDLGAMIFHWDGTTWSGTMIPGADHLYALKEAADGMLWAGGIEIARDQSDTRGALFRWDGTRWQRVPVPPLTGGIYALGILSGGKVVLGGEFTALRSGLEWQPISTDIAGFGWIVDIEQDLQGNLWALTHSGNIFELGASR